jgi:hypothetical protein
MVLVIRQAQMAALQRDSDVRWYEAQLCGLYPQFAEAPAQQRFRWVREGIERASAARLGRDDFFQFLCFEQTFHPGCLQEPGFEWARQLLSQTGKEPGECMKQLRQESVRRLLQIEAEQERAELERLLQADEDAAAEADAAADEEDAPQ